MTVPEPDHIAKMDWRINKLSWTTAPFVDPSGQTIPAGASITQAAQIPYDGRQVGFAIPNATALFLDLSYRYHVESEMWLEKAIAEADQFGQLDTDHACIFYERIMSSVIFAFTALEAFVNEEIPDGYIYVCKEKQSTKQYDKEQIERYLSLNVKLGDVLPLALSVRSPKGKSIWNQYDKVRELRDRIIHMKTEDRAHQRTNPKSIWNALLRKPLPATHVVAKNLISYFLNAKGDPPRWFRKCPF
jgi:hypothetical protein